jgi:hypothetical protein
MVVEGRQHYELSSLKDSCQSTTIVSRQYVSPKTKSVRRNRDEVCIYYSMATKKVRTINGRPECRTVHRSILSIHIRLLSRRRLAGMEEGKSWLFVCQGWLLQEYIVRGRLDPLHPQLMTFTFCIYYIEQVMSKTKVKHLRFHVSE